MGHFYVDTLFSFSTLSSLLRMGGACIAVLNFRGAGIGLLLWEVGGLGLPFSCVPPLSSPSDHFLLLSVHEYKKKNVHMYKFLRSCANI